MKNSKIETPIKKVEQKHEEQQFQNKQIKGQIEWINERLSYETLSNDDIIMQNRKILETLKRLQNKLTEELKSSQGRRSINDLSKDKIKGSDKQKILSQKIKNNEKLIMALNNDKNNAQRRIDKIVLGLEQSTVDKKFNIEKQISSLKQQIKKVKLQYHQSDKFLQNHQDQTQFQGVALHNRLQQQLKSQSIKYVRLLQKYNKTVQKLANEASIKNINHQIQIPEEILNQDLEEKQSQQYQEYQSIVKLSTVLDKRNYSEHNKAQRIYNQRLKQLQRMITNLGNIDRIIMQRETQLLESRKNLQFIKIKVNNRDTVDELRTSTYNTEMILRQKSYSTSKLSATKLSSDGENGKKRGNSFIKLLPTKLMRNNQ